MSDRKIPQYMIPWLILSFDAIVVGLIIVGILVAR